MGTPGSILLTKTPARAPIAGARTELAGVCDRNQKLCFALAVWNGRDPLIKERMFGLANGEGNHGEDVKEYYWYADATPTASWLSWLYHYPQAAFPYARLREENAKRSRKEREFELCDTGIFDEGRYWKIGVDYAKESPFDLCIRIRIRNVGPDAATLVVLPTLWYRNRWSWDIGAPRPVIAAEEIAGREAVSRLRPMARESAGALPPAAIRKVLRPSSCSARTRRTFRACSAARRGRVPEGWDQRSRRLRRGDSQPRAAWDEDGVLVQAHGAPGQRGRASTAPCARRCRRHVDLGEAA